MSSNIHFISAGAGSGKTHNLTLKLKDLLASAEIEPAGVIATTFTKLAAGELQERVRSELIKTGQLAVANQMEQSLIGTVNSVCGELLRRFAFEAGMPPDQQVLDEAQGSVLFYQAMELTLSKDKKLVRQMNAVSHRLQILDQQNKQLLWRSEIKEIADAARANNQSADDIRNLGKGSAEQLLAHFPSPTKRDLSAELLGAVNHALSEADPNYDSTKTSRTYFSFLKGIQAALIHRRLAWPEWISLSKKQPGAKSRELAQPIVDIAVDYARHPELHRDIQFYTKQLFEIAALSLDSYQLLKTQKGLIDFVDQEQRLYQLLDDAAVADVLREDLQLLMVDEFQDTSPIELALFIKLSRLASRVIWVGDVKQSIYGFRGSDPTLMSAVVTQVLREGNPLEILEYSWRSRPELVAYTNNLFVPAFAESLSPEQVQLKPARQSVSREPVVETWRLNGRNKDLRARALANGIQGLMNSGREVCDKDSDLLRPLEFGDIAVLCRTHSNLATVAAALGEAGIPVAFQRAGLLHTPEGCLALACLRRLIDPSDTLATAEILSLTSCSNPEELIAERLSYLMQEESISSAWMEDVPDGPIAALRAQRMRLPYLTPVEALRVALDAAKVHETINRWGPTEQRSKHRLNNIAALIVHAEEYLEQCTAQSEPATAAGLVLWLQALSAAEEDTQSSGGAENAIQLVTHHGAKGLEWPLVVAMDLDATLKPRIWGLNVLAAPEPISLEAPLANRTLRYWPRFFGLQSANISLLDQIEASEVGLEAMKKEIEEARRLLYVSLTRPRESLILTVNNDKESGPWMDTLDADWMLPKKESLTLPDNEIIPSRYLELDEEDPLIPDTAYEPNALVYSKIEKEILPFRQSPSTISAIETARIGKVIELGDRLSIQGKYDPATLGSALHAVIACTLLDQPATERVLLNYGVQEAISAQTADDCCKRLLENIQQLFSPVTYYVEHPISYINKKGQLISGWIDLLLETKEGFVLIDHKASPRGRSDWNEVALSYSGQLQCYAECVNRATNRPILSSWIHFALTGGLVEVIAEV